MTQTCALCSESLAGTKKSDIFGPYSLGAGQAQVYLHNDCAVWTPEIYYDPKSKALKNVKSAIKRSTATVSSVSTCHHH